MVSPVRRWGLPLLLWTGIGLMCWISLSCGLGPSETGSPECVAGPGPASPLHGGLGLVALICGMVLVQSKRDPARHPVLMSLYALAVLGCVFSGAALMAGDPPYWPERLGRVVWGALWLGSCLRAVWKADTAEIGAARFWLALSFSLAFAAISFRVLTIVLMIGPGLPVAWARPLALWSVLAVHGLGVCLPRLGKLRVQ